MKSEALKELESLAMKNKRTKYPNIKEHALPVVKYNDNTANSLTKAILAWLELNGHKAWRQGSEGRYRPGKEYVDVIGRTRLMKGSYIPGLNKGHSDVQSIIDGRFVAWEIKIGKDKQSAVQKQFQQEVEKAGGKYFLIPDFDTFMRHYKQLTK
jgi:hypothetical protein